MGSARVGSNPAGDATFWPPIDPPPWLSWQSARLLTDRSLVRAQVEALLLESTVRVDSSVARIPAFQAGGPGSIPGRRTVLHN